jgi:hypothetical protein
MVRQGSTDVMANEKIYEVYGARTSVANIVNAAKEDIQK